MLPIPAAGRFQAVPPNGLGQGKLHCRRQDDGAPRLSQLKKEAAAL